MLLLLGLLTFGGVASAQTSCQLEIGAVYKTANSNAVWAVTEGCQKRPILNPAVFFSHYASWDDVEETSQASLDSVQRHPLNFLPWGRLRNFENGSLIKTVDDPNVYLKLGDRLHTFSSESAFYAFGYEFGNVEDVTAEVISQHTVSTPITGTDSAPEGLVFKYPNAPQVYRLERRAGDGAIVKRHVRTYEEFAEIYRTNLLVDLPAGVVFPDLAEGEESTTDDTNTPSPGSSTPTPPVVVTPPVVTPAPVTPTTPSEPSTPVPATPAPTTPNSSGAGLGITSPYTSYAVGALGEPTLGQTVTDPVLGASIRKLAEVSGNGFRRHIYSQIQAFNADSSMAMLLSANDVSIYDVSTGAQLYTIPNDINSPRWNPANREEVFFYDSNDTGSGNTLVRFERYNVVTGARSTVFTFPARYQTIAGAQSWEEVSRDGRWAAAMLRRADGGVSYAMLNIVEARLGAVLDRESIASSAGCDAGDNDINWVAPSPLGNYMVIQWNRDGSGLCEGVEARNIETGAYVGHVSDNRQHSDMGLDENGNEIYVSPYFGSSLFVASTRLPGSTNFLASYDNVLADVGWYHFGHISCKGPQGLCVVSGEGAANSPFGGEIYLIYTDSRAADNGQNDAARVRRLAHHRSSNYDYWAQPQPSISADGSYIIFASDWGNAGRDSYVIDLRNRDISSPAPVGTAPVTTPAPVVTPDPTPTTPDPTPTPDPEPVSANSSEIDLGANGLPNSTYASQGSNGSFTLGLWFGNPAGSNYVELLTSNTLGTPCSSADFANIRFFIQTNQSGNYSRIESSTYLGTDDGGCFGKDNMMTSVPLTSGTHNVVACVANDDFSNNYCTDPMVVVTSDA